MSSWKLYLEPSLDKFYHGLWGKLYDRAFAAEGILLTAHRISERHAKALRYCYCGRTLKESYSHEPLSNFTGRLSIIQSIFYE